MAILFEGAAVGVNPKICMTCLHSALWAIQSLEFCFVDCPWIFVLILAAFVVVTWLRQPLGAQESAEGWLTHFRCRVAPRKIWCTWNRWVRHVTHAGKIGRSLAAILDDFGVWIRFFDVLWCLVRSCREPDLLLNAKATVVAFAVMAVKERRARDTSTWYTSSGRWNLCLSNCRRVAVEGGVSSRSSHEVKQWKQSHLTYLDVFGAC